MRGRHPRYVRRVSARSLALVLVLAGACAGDEREKPEAPDLQPLADAYAAPTRDFDAQAGAEVQALVERKVRQLIETSGIVGRIEDALGALDEAPAMSLTGVLQRPV